MDARRNQNNNRQQQAWLKRLVAAVRALAERLLNMSGSRGLYL